MNRSAADSARRRTLWFGSAAIVVVLAAVAALALWILNRPPAHSRAVGPLDSSSASSPAPTPSTTPVSSRPGAPRSSAPAGSDGPGLSLPALGTDSTQLSALGAPRHRVVVTLRSDGPLPLVSYRVKGQTTDQNRENVRSPVVIVRYVGGNRPYAAVAFQKGTSTGVARCAISIDGQTVASNSVTQPYGVTACLG